ncbi:Endoplasmic reticulum-Golgi intermediate compartment protein 2 [Lemmus lemmus]
MRRLNRTKTLSLVKELDAFPKVPDSYVETSATGGTVSLIAFATMALLTIMEFSVYQDTWMKYEYEVDKDFSSMFDLSPQQREWQRMLQLIQSRLQEEHSLQDVIFKSAFKSASTALPPREDDPSLTPDACRIHGHLYINKVAGNFHITVDNQMFQYFITVVPTKLHTYKISADTHQFSVTERERIINHAAGSHGVSGIFMKYDLSSLMVTVTEEHMPFWQFFVRLCGIIGGIFSTTGMLHGIGKFIVEIICCRFRLGSYKPIHCVPFEDGHTDNHLPLLENNTH